MMFSNLSNKIELLKALANLVRAVLFAGNQRAFIAIIWFVCSALVLNAQNIIKNADFQSGGEWFRGVCGGTVENWYYETTYGGGNRFNKVMEIDDASCPYQDVCVLPNTRYELSFVASRRTRGSTPAAVSTEIKIELLSASKAVIGIPMSKIFTRNNTWFNLTPVDLDSLSQINTTDDTKYIRISLVDKTPQNSTFGMITDNFVMNQVVEIEHFEFGCNGEFKFGLTPNLPDSATYSWTFASGFPNASSSSNEIVQYDNEGAYDVVCDIGNGVCSVIVIDSLFQIEITDPIGMVLGSKKPSCYRGLDGLAFVEEITGGTPNYTFQWQNMQLGDTATGGAGLYKVIGTDSRGCVDSAEVVVLNPEKLVLDTITTLVSCPGASDGTIVLDASGGTGSYVFNVNEIPFGENKEYSGLPYGQHIARVQDANGCIDSLVVWVRNANTAIYEVDVDIFPTACGQSIGSCTVKDVKGGTSPYTYSLNGGTYSSDTQFRNLKAGDYWLSIKDNLGCTYDTLVNVTSSSGISRVTLIGKNGSCGNLGEITVQEVMDGERPFQYVLNGGVAQTDSIFLGVQSGNNVVRVTDNNRCSYSKSITIQNFENPKITLDDFEGVSCFGLNDGFIKTTITGNGHLTIDWNIDPNFHDDDLTSIGPGNYECIVTDERECADTLKVLIEEPSLLLVSISTKESACGTPTGTATAEVTGGYTPYNYDWGTSPVQYTETANKLWGGRSYTLSIQDNNGCSIDTVVEISTANGPIAKVVNVYNATCADNANGRIEVEVSNGTIPYTYSWNTVPEQTDSVAVNLDEGNYTLTATDAMGCSVSISQSVTKPLPITANLDVFDDPCSQFIGRISANASGGTGDLNYSWNTNPIQTSSVAYGLGIGIYQLTVVDSNGCAANFSDTVHHIPKPLFTNIQVTDANCKGGSDGQIQVSATGATPNLKYEWNTNPAQNASLAIGLMEGNYKCTVTDDNNCQADTLVTVGFTNPIPFFTFPADTAFCEKDSVLLYTTENAESYEWYPNGESTASVYAKSGGEYRLTIGEKGCFYTDTIQVREDQMPVLELGDDQYFCEKVEAVFDVTVNGQANYLWNDGDVSSLKALSVEGVYWVQIQQKRCTVSDTISVFRQPQLIVNLPMNDTLCEGDTYEIVPSLIGEIDPQFEWSLNQVNSKSITVDSTGYYSVLVTDGVCAARDTMHLEFLQVPHVDLGEDITICENETLELNSGYPQFDNSWSTGTSTNNIWVEDAGVYSVVVSNYICSGFDEIQVFVQPLPTFNLGNDTSICIGDKISIGVELTNVQYKWNLAGETMSHVNRGNGIHILTVTQNNCAQNDTLIIGQYALPDILPIRESKCFLDTISVETICSNCVGYQWSNGDTTSMISFINPFEGTVTGVTLNGCRSTVPASVSNYYSKGCFPQFFVPSAFTPDNDGINDMFKPVYSRPELLEEYRLDVFNRWGEIVFTATKLDQVWDGMYRREEAQIGSYAWKIQYKTLNSKEVNTLFGKINVLR